MNKHIKRIPLYALALVVLSFLIIWGAALLKCEYLTNRYYDEFEFAYKNNTMISEPKYFKVLSCNEDAAEVYYVSDDCGDVLTFENQNGNWVETRWNTVWSKQGSASSAVWPYWWQYFITGF